jgi:hypothetical protein
MRAKTSQALSRGRQGKPGLSSTMNYQFPLWRISGCFFDVVFFSIFIFYYVSFG